MTRLHPLLIIAAICALLLPVSATRVHASDVAAHARAQPKEQNLGYWNVTCRAVWGNSAMTLTFGSDGAWADQACNNVVDNSDASNQYQFYPLDQPRPGFVQCAYIFTYGGYWLQERPPYTQGYTGQAQIAVRDDLSYDDASLAQGVCESVGNAAEIYNGAHGFNSPSDPLAPIQECTNCGGGGGGAGPAPVGTITTLPGSLKAKKHVAKPLVCITGGKYGNKPHCTRPH